MPILRGCPCFVQRKFSFSPCFIQEKCQLLLQFTVRMSIVYTTYTKSPHSIDQLSQSLFFCLKITDSVYECFFDKIEIYACKLNFPTKFENILIFLSITTIAVSGTASNINSFPDNISATGNLLFNLLEMSGFCSSDTFGE